MGKQESCRGHSQGPIDTWAPPSKQKSGFNQGIVADPLSAHQYSVSFHLFSENFASCQRLQPSAPRLFFSGYRNTRDKLKVQESYCPQTQPSAPEGGQIPQCAPALNGVTEAHSVLCLGLSPCGLWWKWLDNDPFSGFLLLSVSLCTLCRLSHKLLTGVCFWGNWRQNFLHCMGVGHKGVIGCLYHIFTIFPILFYGLTVETVGLKNC